MSARALILGIRDRLRVAGYRVALFRVIDTDDVLPMTAVRFGEDGEQTDTPEPALELSTLAVDVVHVMDGTGDDPEGEALAKLDVLKDLLVQHVADRVETYGGAATSVVLDQAFIETRDSNSDTLVIAVRLRAEYSRS